MLCENVSENKARLAILRQIQFIEVLTRKLRFSVNMRSQKGYNLSESVWYYGQQEILENYGAFFIQQNGIFPEDIFKRGGQNYFRWY